MKGDISIWKGLVKVLKRSPFTESPFPRHLRYQRSNFTQCLFHLQSLYNPLATLAETTRYCRLVTTHGLHSGAESADI